MSHVQYDKDQFFYNRTDNNQKIFVKNNKNDMGNKLGDWRTTLHYAPSIEVLFYVALKITEDFEAGWS